jgi:hypothetical protein
MSASQYDYEAALVRMQRDREESEKLYREGRKFIAEEYKLHAEELKLTREYRLAPIVMVSSILSAALTGLAVALIMKFLH